MCGLHIVVVSFESVLGVDIGIYALMTDKIRLDRKIPLVQSLPLCGLVLTVPRFLENMALPLLGNICFQIQKLMTSRQFEVLVPYQFSSVDLGRKAGLDLVGPCPGGLVIGHSIW